MYVHIITSVKPYSGDFPGGRGHKNLPANAGDTRLIPDLGTVHGITKSWDITEGLSQQQIEYLLV